jgi:phenylacetate-CoA ligase
VSDLQGSLRRLVKSWIPFPYVFGPTFARVYNALMRSQWSSLEQLEQLQLAKLQELARQAYAHVRYYQRTFDQVGIRPDDITSLDVLAVLPTIGKSTLRDHFDDLTADNASRRYHPVTRHTSGSTGIPQKFLQDRENLTFERATVWRHYDWAGYRYQEPTAILRGKVVPEGGFWYLSDDTTLILSSFKLKSETLDHYIQALRQFRPTLIQAYPSSIYFLARLLERRGVDDIQPRSIMTASETLLPHQRECIERVFNCKVFDWYGSGEHVAIISQCPAGKYHVHMEYGIVEYVERPEFSRAGELAYEIICTGLNNFSMPLLRYSIGDIVRIRDGEECDCGRGLPVVSAIEGRLDDVIVSPDGRVIPASGMTLAFEFIETIAQAQLYQEDIQELVIRVVKTEGYSEEDHQFMLDQVRSRLGDAMRIRVDLVSEIQRLPSGKQPFAISKVRPD